MKPYISIVSPVYRGENMVAELVRRNVESVSTITDEYEIILVNDASPDNSWEEIVKQCAANPNVKGINLSRNFGQHYAITAGLHYAKGDWVVVMDCDLQDQPEEIPNLYKKAQEGWNIVYARRMNKKFGFFKKLSSTVFHSLYNWISGMKTDDSIGNFGIYSHKVIDEYNKMGETSRSFGTLVYYLGFPYTTIDVEHSERMEGRSSYTLRKLLKLAFDVMISNTNKPLKITVGVGFMMAGISFLLALYNVIAKWLGLIMVQGYTTTVFSIWFVGGVLLTLLGIIGLYIGKIFDQVKNRPLYVVSEEINIQN
jgi:dolichol-phosphate mannosyltransferase